MATARRNFDALGQVFLFEQLPLRYLGRVLDACELKRIRAGRIVVEEGEPFAGFGVVTKGRFELSRGDGTSAELNEGDAFGAATLLKARPARATLRALEDSYLLVLKTRRFRKLVARKPHLGHLLLYRLARHLARELDRATAADKGAGAMLF